MYFTQDTTQNAVAENYELNFSFELVYRVNGVDVTKDYYERHLINSSSNYIFTIDTLYRINGELVTKTSYLQALG